MVTYWQAAVIPQFSTIFATLKQTLLLDFQFQYPLAFWLLLLVPLLALLYLFYTLWRRRSIRKVGDLRLIQSLTNRSPVRAAIKFFLILLAVALGCIAIANPRKPDAESGEVRKGIDLVFAVDVSNSMLATDIEPSRLARAKYFMSQLIARLPNDRVGLVEFAGSAYLQMPITFDHDAARMYISALNPGSIHAQGTSISDALKKADIAFGDNENRFRSVVLITDGETHDEDALDVAKDLAKKGVMINTVGIGSAQGANIIDPATGQLKRDPLSGQVVVSRLNEQILQQLAAATNGTYVHFKTAEDAVAAILQQYSGIERKALGNASLYNYETFYMWLAAPMLLLLLLELFWPERKKQMA